MLTRLYIRNFALIEEEEIRFGKGFNVLTGETGAGKSLLMGALGLILGKRVDFSFLFRPEEKCIVEAVFTGIPPALLSELKKFEGFDLEEDTLILRREAAASGKSRAFINDTPVSLNELKAVAGLLVDLHGQHENQLLLSPEQQLRLLDQYAGTTAAAEVFAAKLNKLKESISEKERLEAREREAVRQQDYLRFQFSELSAARLDAEEASSLESRVQTLQHAEQITETLLSAAQNLYHTDGSLHSSLAALVRQLRKTEPLLPALHSVLERLDEALSTVQDAAFLLDEFREKIDQDPAKLQEITERLDSYNRLKLKFAARTVEELIALREDFRRQLADFESTGDQIETLKKEIQVAETELAKLAAELEVQRSKAIPKLEKQIQSLLKEVALDKAKFSAALERRPEPDGPLLVDGKRYHAYATGMNVVDFRISTGPGLPEGPLSRIASGGEISRVMLAIKAALAEKAALSVLIFDEIDTGISGEAAQRVGAVMRRLSSRYQVIAITHLPQIAGKGDTHLVVRKEMSGKTTRSSISGVDGDARILELAKMLSGDPPPKSAIANAKELISSSGK